MGKDISPEKVAIHNLTTLAAPRAAADPLPGPLYEAFSDETIVVEGIPVRPVMPGDWIILRKLNSPLYRITIENEPEKVEFTDEDAIEIIFQFTRPAKEVRDVLNKGVPHFKEVCQQEIADKIPTPMIAKLSAAIREQLNRCYSTQIKYMQESEGAEVRNFQEQPPLEKTA